MKINATGPSGGAGGDLGVGSDNVMGVLPGQLGLLQSEPPNREEVIQEKQKKRKRKWRLLKDRQYSQQV